MSESIHMMLAADCPVTFMAPGEVVGEDTIDNDQYGLVIADPGNAAIVLVGTPLQLRELADRLMQVVGVIERIDAL